MTIPPERITKLKRDLTACITNIPTAADARESMRRKEVEDTHKIRLERLENHMKISQEKFEEITKGWSIVKEKATLQELREARDRQQHMCTLLLEDKKKIINDLQQEMKIEDDHYVKDLRRHAEELDLMIERMEDNMKTLQKAYREEMSQIKRVYEQQIEFILTKDVTEWEQLMQELLDNEVRIHTHPSAFSEAAGERKETVEEYEAKLHREILESMDNENIRQLQDNAKLQVEMREQGREKVRAMVNNREQIRKRHEEQECKLNLMGMRRRILSLQNELKNLKTQYRAHMERTREARHNLSKQIKSSIQKYERIQKKIKHFAVADATTFKEMWITLEVEVKQLVERSLVIDSLICKQHLGLAWERPAMAFMKLSGPICPKKQVHEAVAQVNTSDGLRLEAEAENTDMEREGTECRGESDAEVDYGKLSLDTAKKVLELLCDEAGFLLEDTLVQLLTPLEKEKQTALKMASLLCSFGIEDKDVPKLVHFILNYRDEQRERAEQEVSGEAVESSSTSNLTSDLIHPNHVLPALKIFLKQHMREKQQTSLVQIDARDSSEDEAYWESMGNAISEDKVKLWELAENILNQYLEVLTEISELVPEAEGLWQQNAELRTLLQQFLISQVCVCFCVTQFFRYLLRARVRALPHQKCRKQ
ncbi:hypothetical protein INR49_028588 [Caranx melampygus]|nr:hypothetical protein INR49_028588 [Caranx melampygus]